MMPNKRLFFLLYIAIAVSTIGGILLHECGHWVAHRYYGNKSRISYASTKIYEPNEILRRLRSIEAEYPRETDNNLDFPLKKEYDTLAKEARREGIVMVAAGPFVTTCLVLIALLVLFGYHKKNDNNSLSLLQWFFVCLSLFCLRNIYDLIKSTISFSISRYKNIHGDEFELADYLGWNPWSIPIVMTIISMVVICVVIFRIVPRRQQATFFFAGLLAELSVLYFWIILLGPKLMP